MKRITRGFPKETYQRVSPDKYKFTQEETNLSNQISLLEKELDEKAKIIHSSICVLQDKCNHKIYKEHDEEGKNTWIGKEYKEFYYCIICDAEFIGYYYRIGE